MNDYLPKPGLWTSLGLALAFEFWLARQRLVLLFRDLAYVFLLLAFYKPRINQLPRLRLLRGSVAMGQGPGRIPALRLSVTDVKPQGIIGNGRLVRLQSGLVVSSFRRLFSIDVEPKEAAILGSFRSIPWLMAQLFRCAGLGKKSAIGAKERDLLQRIYPLYVALMSLNLSQATMVSSFSSAPKVQAIIDKHTKQWRFMKRQRAVLEFRRRIFASQMEHQLQWMDRKLQAVYIQKILEKSYRGKSKYMAKAIGGLYE